MRIRKAVITAAGKEPEVAAAADADRPGRRRKVGAHHHRGGGVARQGGGDLRRGLAGRRGRLRAGRGNHAGRLTFVPQREPRGYGHAIYCAQDFTGRDPFLHLVGDHLYVSRTAKGCAQHLVEMAEAENCAVSAVQASRESLLPHYGAVGGQRVAGRQDLYRIENVIEKPTPTEAEQRLIVPGLRAGHYLCFFGMHVLTPAVMDLLGEALAKPGGAAVTLSRRPWRSWPPASTTWRWRSPAGATTSASSTAC